MNVTVEQLIDDASVQLYLLLPPPRAGSEGFEPRYPRREVGMTGPFTDGAQSQLESEVAIIQAFLGDVDRLLDDVQPLDGILGSLDQDPVHLDQLLSIVLGLVHGNQNLSSLSAVHGILTMHDCEERLAHTSVRRLGNGHLAVGIQSPRRVCQLCSPQITQRRQYIPTRGVILQILKLLLQAFC